MKVALVGACPSSRLLAPYRDPQWQIWGCSPDNARIMPRIDAWFDPHGDLGWPHAPSWEENYLAWMRALPCRVYVQRTDLIPNAIEFPAYALVQQFGGFWFTSTMAWMMAFAITQDVEEIGIYGADMAARTEYAVQKPAMHHWMHEAATRGIKVYVPPESDLLQPPPLYGYSVMSPMGRKLEIREREIGSRVVDLESSMEQIKYDLAYLRGSRESNDYARSIWTGSQDGVLLQNLNLEK